MSRQHPIVAVTGSSGSGSPVVTSAIEHVLGRLDARFVIIDGDGFHQYDRQEFQNIVGQATQKGQYMSHFSPAANHLDKLAALFEEYGEYGTGSHRQYIHDEEDALQNGGQIGSFTPWSPLAADTDLIVYEGLHGCFKSDAIDIAQHVDLKVGVTPIVNLEWMQKVHRDTHMRGYSQEAVADTIQRRLSDYVRYITPQFSQTDINFQRIPMVDTSNPFEHQPLPGLDESKLVVRFRHPAKMPYSFPELLGKIPDAFMSRRNSIVIPGSEFELALQLILEPLISRLLDSRG